MLTQRHKILDEVTVKLLPIATDLGSAYTRNLEESGVGKARVDEFVHG